ncbi:FecR family protein [Alteromonas sp. a30]|uniref:FecR family protein n=1 Tax=Alteromonas sp. a30 TaxID=2730917 RepID=UPI00227E722D|nr:FecR family protein [Alteromonas sp. a30]MCY7295463.1 FecR domain-containing protein [Alteromonas sp. a30]
MLKQFASRTVLSALFLCAMSSALASEQAGKTIIAKGQVKAFDNPAQTRALKRRSPIFDIDTVTTSASSKAQFRMNDGTMLALKASSKVLISEYHYTPGKEDNSAVIELVEGGLRSITGAIKANNGKYQVKTPVGSIGIRGTHFEIEIIQGDVFLAVWDGAIDLSLQGSSNTVSLGEGEDFSFGKVDRSGNVELLLEAPDNFNKGHSSDAPNAPTLNANNDASASENESTTSPPSSAPQFLGPPAPTQPNVGSAPESGFLANNDDVIQQLVEETVVQNDITSPDVIANRMGEFTYSTLVSSELNTSAGGASGLQISMTVDFDNGFVPDGSLTFTDNQGEWFAVFNGVIDLNEILLGVNFASHGNELASGDISALFSNDGDRISGEFNLFEINNPSTNANGRFQIE